MSGKLRKTTGRAVTNVVRTCGPTHLLVFDFMSNKICLNHVRKMGRLKTVCNGTQFIVGKFSASREGVLKPRAARSVSQAELPRSCWGSYRQINNEQTAPKQEV